MKIIKKNILFTWAILTILLFLYCKKDPEIQVINKNEYYIVIDTSGSMAGRPFRHIQKKFAELLSFMKSGDTIYIITFDSEPKLLKKIDNYSLEKKEEILQLIQVLKPLGLYTDFQLLLDYLRDLLSKTSLEEQKFDQEKNILYKTKINQYVIVLTDGKDEPKKKRKLVNIKDYSTTEQLPIQDRYIYYISFAEKKSEQLEKNLKDLSSNVKVIERPVNSKQSVQNAKNNINRQEDASTTIKDPSGLEELKQDLEQKQSEVQKKNDFINIYHKILSLINHYKYIILISLLLVLILGALIFYRFKPEPMKGELIFYESGMHPSVGRAIKLNRFEKKTLSIGNDPSCLIRIKQKDFPKKVELKAVDKNDDYYFKIPSKYLKDVQLITSDKNVIHSGDKFKIKNYIFEYNYGSKRKA